VNRKKEEGRHHIPGGGVAQSTGIIPIKKRQRGGDWKIGMVNIREQN